MATPQITPQPSPGPATPSQTPPPGGGAGASGGPAQDLARLAMDAQKISSQFPETAQMMREVQNQVRMATMKMIQQRQASQQATPAI